MAILPLSKAAMAAGISRQTIYRYAKQGKLSTVQLHDGTIGVDTAELLRVFGKLLQPEVVPGDSARHEADNLRQVDAMTVSALQAEISGLNGKVAILERQVEASQDREYKLLGIIEAQTRLIGHQSTSPVNRPYWKRVLLAIILGIVVFLAWNTVTKEKPSVQAPKINNLERWHPENGG